MSRRTSPHSDFSRLSFIRARAIAKPTFYLYSIEDLFAVGPALASRSGCAAAFDHIVTFNCTFSSVRGAMSDNTRISGSTVFRCMMAQGMSRARDQWFLLQIPKLKSPLDSSSPPSFGICYEASQEEFDVFTESFGPALIAEAVVILPCSTARCSEINKQRLIARDPCSPRLGTDLTMSQILLRNVPAAASTCCTRIAPKVPRYNDPHFYGCRSS